MRDHIVPFVAMRSATKLEDNSIPVAIYDATTDKLIGKFPTIKKATAFVTGKSTSGHYSKLFKKKKNGKSKTMKARNGDVVYFVKINKDEVKMAPFDIGKTKTALHPFGR